MTLFLILALALVAASAVLMLRSFALASVERRRTLDQISAYGFHSEAVAEEAVDLRASFGDLAEATGERLSRFERLRAGERGLRELLNSAGMYGMSVPAFVGRHPRRHARPGAAVAHDARRPARLQVAPGGRAADGDGLVPALCPGAASRVFDSSRSIVRSRAGRPARYDGGGRRRIRGGLQLASAASRARSGRSCGSREQSPRPHTEETLNNLSPRRQPGDARVHAGARAGRIPRRLDRNDPPRPGDRHAEAASAERGRARTEDADKDPLPPGRADPAGTVHRHAPDR